MVKTLFRFLIFFNLNILSRYKKCILLADLRRSKRGKLATKYHKKLVHKRQSNPDNPNRFCTCAERLCSCCRNFNMPVLNLKGPGCAALEYLQSDKLAISMSFNERVLANTTLKGKLRKIFSEFSRIEFNTTISYSQLLFGWYIHLCQSLTHFVIQTVLIICII